MPAFPLTSHAISTGSVSVIIRAWNAAATIERALRSVIRQSRPADEIIVVDDGSDDATAQIASSFADDRVRLVSHGRNRGGSAALQSGIDAALCDWIAFLDADDTWHPDKLERQFEALAAMPNAVMAGCAFDLVTPDGSRTPTFTADFPFSGADFWRNQLQSSAVLLSSAIVRRDAAIASGPLDPDMRTGHDQALLVRVARQGAVAFIHAPLVDYHWVATGISRTRKPKSSLGVLAMHLAHIEMFSDRLTSDERRQLIGRRNGEAANDLINGRAWIPGLKCAARAIIGGDPMLPHLSRIAANLPGLRTLRRTFKG